MRGPGRDSRRGRIEAVIFDVDGTLAETEEIHRAAFNATFRVFKLDWDWSVDLYRELLRVTGGKERMRHHADSLGATLSDEQIADMHRHKTELYTNAVRAGRRLLRSGIAQAIDLAVARGLRLAIATTTSHANVEALLDATLDDRLRRFEVIVAGDDVARKKPAPDVYEAVLARLELPAEACLAIEDSANGVAAARAAGIEVWVTPSLYTAHESFEGAALVLTDLSGFERLLEARR